jgi:hypothetical protein
MVQSFRVRWPLDLHYQTVMWRIQNRPENIKHLCQMTVSDLSSRLTETSGNLPKHIFFFLPDIAPEFLFDFSPEVITFLQYCRLSLYHSAERYSERSEKGKCGITLPRSKCRSVETTPSLQIGLFDATVTVSHLAPPDFTISRRAY